MNSHTLMIFSKLVALAHACESNPYDDAIINAMKEAIIATSSEIPSYQVLTTISTLESFKNQLSPGCQYCASPCEKMNDIDLSSIANGTPESKEKEELISGMQKAAMARPEAVASHSRFAAFILTSLCALEYTENRTHIQSLIKTSKSFY